MRRPIASFEEARVGVLGVSEPQKTLRLDSPVDEGPPTLVVLGRARQAGRMLGMDLRRKEADAGQCALARSSKRTRRLEG